MHWHVCGRSLHSYEKGLKPLKLFRQIFATYPCRYSFSKKLRKLHIPPVRCLSDHNRSRSIFGPRLVLISSPAPQGFCRLFDHGHVVPLGSRNAKSPYLQAPHIVQSERNDPRKHVLDQRPGDIGPHRRQELVTQCQLRSLVAVQPIGAPIQRKLHGIVCCPCPLRHEQALADGRRSASDEEREYDVGLIQCQALPYEAAHGYADDVGCTAMSVRPNELSDVMGRIGGRAWCDMPRLGVQREIGEEEVEVGKVRDDERELKATGETSVKKDNSCRSVII